MIWKRKTKAAANVAGSITDLPAAKPGETGIGATGSIAYRECFVLCREKCGNPEDCSRRQEAERQECATGL